MEASGISSSLQWLRFDFLAHYCVLTKSIAQLITTMYKFFFFLKAAKRSGKYCLKEKLLWIKSKSGHNIFNIVTWILKQKTAKEFQDRL